MQTTIFVGRTRALAAALACFGLAATHVPAQADTPLCPDCPSIQANISYDPGNRTFALEIEAFSGFDYTGVDAVELELADDGDPQVVQLGFGPSDVEYGVYETGSLPSGISGDGTTAELVFFDQATLEEVRVKVPSS